MSFNIKTYRNLSEPERFNKELTNEETYTGTLRAGCDILTPVIRITGNIDLLTNYMYIQEFGRYYFVSVQNVRDGVWDLVGEVDELTSFKEYIKKCECIARRNSNKVDAMLTDEFNLNYQNPWVVVKKFPNAMEDDTLVLITT